MWCSFRKSIYLKIVLVIFYLALTSWSTSDAESASAPDKEDPGRIQPGDLVAVDYVAALENGQIFRTTLVEIAEDARREKAAEFTAPEDFGPEEFLAGKEAAIPGLANQVIGMRLGEKKRITLAPSEAFGGKDPEKLTAMARIQRMPRLAKISPMQWAERFEEFPEVGREVELIPYFKSRVTRVEEQFVELEALVAETKIVESAVGPVEIRLEGDDVVAELQPKIGTPYQRDDQIGRIVSADETTYSVDFNPKLAGEKIVVDLEVVDLIKASAFQEDIAWIEDHDQGLEKASETGKPVVLVLYAGWCGWSKKLLNESLTDPRIKVLKDRFTWVKVDSDQEKSIKDVYKQTGYPMIVLLDKDGKVVNKLDGFRDAVALRKELKSLI